MVQTVNKWGHSLGVRIPSQLAKKRNIEEGMQIEIIETKEGILLKTIESKLTMGDILDSIPDDYEAEDVIPDMLPSEEW